ncbi:MAG: hypothetical protein ACI85F_001926 [Bacteroidia bacterium]|jgi:hypothetical protein
MRFLKSILLATLTLSCINAFSQNTVGLLSYNPIEAYEGYNLMFPHNQSNVYLLNNCGEVVKTWQDSVYKPGNSAYLDGDGNLYKAIGRGPASNSLIHAGGGGEALEIRDWNDNVTWRWFYNDSTVRLHHDFTIMPNGNILAIAWDRKLSSEVIAAGKDTSQLNGDEMWPEHIIEIQPIGSDSANIVWRWNAWDHLIQDHDSTKANFGSPSLHRELIDINKGNGVADWMHSNAMDYNENWDQIMISVPTFNEIWIIDHSTTTAQAASHTGGFSGQGGDLLFRWGNPANYGQGDSSDQKLFFQHDCHWVDQQLTNSDPNYDKILVFNNRFGADYSTVNIIAPVFDSYELGFISSGGTYLPETYDWSYQRPDSTVMHSTGLSTVQRLANGNTLICVGRYGYTFEINEDEEIVWEYKTPLLSGNPVSQGDSLSISANNTFRMNRYSPMFLGDLVNQLDEPSYIELSPDTAFCENILGVNETANSSFSIWPNPTNDIVNLTLDNLNSENLQVFNLMGELVLNETVTSGKVVFDTNSWIDGLYIIRIGEKSARLIVN